MDAENGGAAPLGSGVFGGSDALRVARSKSSPNKCTGIEQSPDSRVEECQGVFGSFGERVVITKEIEVKN